MKKDITDRNDIEYFISKFYSKLLKDSQINHFFEHIIEEKSLEHHLTIIIDFWEDILFGTIKYGKNAMKPHLELNQRLPFSKNHFKIWLNHFNTTIDGLFEGEKVNIAKNRALSIATIMQMKLSK